MARRVSFPTANRGTYGVLAALALALVWSCGSNDPPPPPPNTTPSTVTVASGNNQTAVAGSAVGTAPSVTVRNSDGAALAGVSVTFAVASGGGSVSGAAATTDAQGVATVGDWTLGTTAGANTMTATVGTLTPTVFTATGTAGAPSALTVNAGDAQTATTGMAVPVAPAVEVRDANNNPVSGVSVDFAANNNGSVTGSPAMTDGSGVATVGSWILGDLGANTLDATVQGVSGMVTFSAMSIGIPATVTVAGGDGQSADAGTAVAIAPSAEVRDGSNNLLEGIDVTFAVTGGGGSVTGGTAVTNASGIATLGSWILGTTPGANTMDATVAGVGAPASFTATGVVGPPSQIVVVSGDAQTGTVGTALANPVVFAIQDQFGNGVQGETINLTPDGDGSVGNASPTSDANGEVSETWTLATTPSGAQALNAAAATGGVTPVAASATATSDVETTMAVDAGDGQSGVAGAAVATPPSVLVTDQYGNPVAGVSVTFTPSGDGQVTGSPATTDASGIATVGSWVLETAAGANTLDADATGLTTVTFNATGTVQVGSVVITAGDGQSATVAQTISGVITAQVLDVNTNPAASIPVTFTVTLGGGAVINATQVSDGSGFVTLPASSWTMGTVASANELQVTVDATPSIFALINATATADVPATVTILAGDDQTGGISTNLTSNPTVRALDQFGNPNVGVSVGFVPRAGSGSVGSASVAADASGDANTSWAPGQSGTNLLDVTAGSVTATFFAIASNSAYKLEVIFLSPSTISQKTAFGDAAGRWMDIITGDLTDIDFGGGFGPNACGVGGPNITGVQDDLIIFASLVAIDGPGGILGSAGPCFIRGGSSPPPDAPLTILGVMQFDTADLANLEAAGTLPDVILHEMGHVIGIGTLWNQPPLGLLNNPSLPSSPGADTHFSGANAVAAFNALPGGPWVPPTSASSVVPVENTQGGQGTRDGHWRESTFVIELMTGFIAGAGNPLSTVTIQSLLDMGYAVDINEADPYDLSTDGNPAGIRANMVQGFQLHDDILRMPLKVVDRNGRLVRIVDP